MLLEEGNRCWKVATGNRATVLIDVEAYFNAAVDAMSKAERSIHLLNWALEPETRLQPQPGGDQGRDDGIGGFLKALAQKRPNLDIRLLCWQSALPVAATQKFFPLADRGEFANSPVKFVLDGKIPLGACHHQKILVVDDSLAFCGGADIGQDRWDTTRHLDDDPRRERAKKSQGFYTSRHEVMTLVDGAPAADLGALFRRRWLHCTGETLEAPPAAAPVAWPAGVAQGFDRTLVGLSRTEPGWRGAPEVRENEALQLAAIAAAKRFIYMENQYFTSELVRQALARRLSEADGPEVVLVSGGQSPSYFDRMTMDPTRSQFIAHLKSADRHGRFQIYSPVTSLGRGIIVHAKLTIIDDVLLKIGSANMDNRSFGFDTECDLSIQAAGPAEGEARAAISGLRTDLLAHWLGCAASVVDAAIAAEGSLVRGLESLRSAGYCRLRPISPERLGPLATMIADFHIGDPASPQDSFKPWKRRRTLAARAKAAGLAS